MKLSAAMLKGYAKVGKQCRGMVWEGPNPYKPTAVCALGAAGLGAHNKASRWNIEQVETFKTKVGIAVAALNDDGMCIEDIIGIAQAEGL